MWTRQGAITHYGLQRYEVFSECANFCCLFSLRLLIFYVFAEKKQERRARKGVFCRQKAGAKREKRSLCKEIAGTKREKRNRAATHIATRFL